MLHTITTFLEWFGVCVFALSGALVASRKQMDIVGFALMGSVTGIGGGTIRDLMLGISPVFWVQTPAYLMTCVIVSSLLFLVAGVIQSKYKYLLWLDAVGLALFAVTGASIALSHGAGATIAIAMGVATATFGGMIRDILGGESPIVLSREIYITAAFIGAGTYVGLVELGTAQDIAIIIGFFTALALRSAALFWELSLPRYGSE